MLERHDPPTVCPPFSNYTNGIEVPAGARWLVVSGQVGSDVSGRPAEGFEAQCRQVFANIGAVLASAGMGLEDIVKVGVFLTRAADVPIYRRVRDEILPARTASSLVIVAGLVSPDLLVEIEAYAAKAD